MELILWCTAPRANRQLIGGKAVGLQELGDAGMQVPPWFAITADAFCNFLKEGGIAVEISAAMDSLDVEKMHTVEQASETLRSLIAEAPLPPALEEAILRAFDDLGAQSVAVRSSATAEDSASAAWAGQLETYLHVPRSGLLQRVRECWASLFSPRALYYRAQMHSMEEDISVAVIVQAMVESDVAGVCFSVHPVTEDRNQMLIEAVYGLGESLVSGEVTPDTYVVDRLAKKVVDSRISAQSKRLDREGWKHVSTTGSKMDESEILRLAGLVEKVEAHAGHPVDVEWACAGGTLFLLQSRPITTIRSAAAPKQLFDRSVDWKLFHTRPFSLFGASLWHGWYGSARIRELYGVNVRKGLFLEEHPDVVRFYWSAEDRMRMWESLRTLVADDLARYESLLLRAFELNGEAERYLLDGRVGEGSLAETFDFLVEVPIHATTLPNISFAMLAELHPGAHVLLEYCEKLRAVSYYPRITKELLVPLAVRRLATLGVEHAERRVHLLTLRELLAGQVDALESRERARAEGRRFIYQCIDGLESVEWVPPEEMHTLVLELEHVSSDMLTGDGVRLKGQVAFKGVVRGRARVVLGSGEGQEFEEGDILVTICSSPTMMPLIRKSAAIVTDEGGISCHAAVIARELRKPCVMSTRLATTLIKDGDMVEVDAVQGVVSVLQT